MGAVRGRPLLSFNQLHHPAEELSALTVADHLKSSSFKMCINFTQRLWNKGSSIGDAFDEPDLGHILQPCAAKVIVNDVHSWQLHLSSTLSKELEMFVLFVQH